MATKDLETARKLTAARIGSFRVRELDQLLFEGSDVYGSRAFRQSHIDRLIHRFEHEGCRRLDPLTWIPCEVSSTDLGHLLGEGSPVGYFKDLELPQGQKLRCYQGQHRIAAALQWLDPGDYWWTFDLYDSAKLDDDCRRRLRECDQSSQSFADGDIFRNTRHYQQRGETEAAEEWLAKWSPTKCREFNRIYHPKENKDAFLKLGQKLDLLLQFPALWKSWFMGTHLPSLKCPEELADSLGEIFEAWQSLTCLNPVILDPTTLTLLEGRCPRLSIADREHIDQIFQDGSAFQDVRDHAIRAQLRHAALGYPKIIPSLRTFLENTKYLKAMTDVIKRVLPPKFKGTIRESMFKCYVCPRDLKHQVQISENDYIQKAGSREYGFWAAYRQLFLFSMRHFYGLTDSRPLGVGQSPLKGRFDTSELWTRFKLCANNIGFIFPGSKFLKNSRPTGSIEFAAIHGILTRLRPPELFVYDEFRVRECSNHIAAILRDMVPRKIDNPPAIQSLDNQEDWALEQRCGMTTSSTFLFDQRYLFLHNVYSEDQPARANMTSFAVKRDIFRSFFPDFNDGNAPDLPMSSMPRPTNGGSTPGQIDSAVHVAPVDPVPMNNTPMDDAPMDVAPMDVAPIDVAPMDVALIDDAPMQLALINTAPVVYEPQRQPQSTLLLPNVGPSHNKISIIKQSSNICSCHLNMTPESFYASFQPLSDSCPFVVFFFPSDGIVDFVRHYEDGVLANLCEDDRWFAQAREDREKLQMLSVTRVSDRCRQGPCLLVSGKGYFNSTLQLGPVEKLFLPIYNETTNHWVLPAQ
ncbi:hypothetical protein N7499_008638 [Penicillium canescens]|nr:hypothetical protein N7499_008638 [Penicillium canescens]KAJ6158965.1 hypothetical protein N7485_011791 [Penicillium canescens]